MEIVLVLVSIGGLGRLGPFHQKQNHWIPDFSPFFIPKVPDFFSARPDHRHMRNQEQEEKKGKKPEKREQNENKNWEYESTLLVMET